MLLKPIQRSKSWDTVLSTTTEHEDKEKKKLTKVDSAGVNERRSDDAVAVFPSFKPHDFKITHPEDSTSTTQNYAEWMRSETNRNNTSFSIEQIDSNKGFDNPINSRNSQKQQANLSNEKYTRRHLDTKRDNNRKHLSNQEPFKERHQRLFQFSPDMYEKLLEHRETIERRIAVINKQTRQHGNDSDGSDDGRIDGSIREHGHNKHCDGKNTELLRRRGEGVSLCFDNSCCSVLIDAEEEEKISQAKLVLCQLFPTISIPSTTETDILPSSPSGAETNTDELGLSDLLPSLLLETDMKNELFGSSNDEGRMLNNIGGDLPGSSRPLTYAASWDVSTQPASMGVNEDARRCHSSSGVIPSMHPQQRHLGLTNHQQHKSHLSPSLSQQHRSLQSPQQNLTDHVSLLLQSPLPPELCISDVKGVPNFESQQNLLWARPAQPNATQCDNATKCLNDRRKLESEDSSYDSDHEYIQGQTGLKATLSSNPDPDSSNQTISNWTLSANGDGGSNIWRNQMQPLVHDDVSRSASETLAAEFADYVTLCPALSSVSEFHCNKQTIPIPPRSFKSDVVVNETGTAAPNTSSADIVQDEDYNRKLLKALKLGFQEELLKKALIKLGRNAEDDKILNELIRLQKLTAASDENLHENSSHNLVNEEEISRKSKEPNVTGLSGKVYNESVNDRGIKSSLTTEMPSNDDVLLPIVIDGSNVAMSHGNKDRFSCKGIAIAVDFFRKRGHKNISVFVPTWRKESSKPESPITDKHLLLELEKDKILSFTPSRQINGKRIVCHDDRYILNLAAETDGIVVSNDMYRELIMDKPAYQKVIEERILMYSFVNDRFMPPDDPLGRNGPSLDAFLRRKPLSGPGSVATAPSVTPCPYGKKCTYGNKCKFYHAERGNQPQKSVTDTLKEHSTKKINEIIKARRSGNGGEKTAESSRDSSPGDQLMRTQSMQPMGRQFYTSSQDKLNQFDSLKSQLGKTISSNPRIDCDPSTLWPANIPPAGIDHQQMQSSQPQQAWNQMKTPPHLPPDTSLPPPHRKITRQLTLNPTFDSRIPLSYQQLNQNHDVHAMNVPPPLPNGASMDPQHHQQPQQGFPYPPPHTGMPPPTFHTKPTGTSSNPSPHHMMLARNASAPEHHHKQQKISLYGTQSTHGSGGGEFGAYAQQFPGTLSNVHSQYQAQQQSNENLRISHPSTSVPTVQKDFTSQQMMHQPMHKTMSDSFVWGSRPNVVGGGNIQNCNSQQQTSNVAGSDKYISVEGTVNNKRTTSLRNKSNAISPLIGVSSVPGVWENSKRDISGNNVSEISQLHTNIDGLQLATNQYDSIFRAGPADHEINRNLGPIGSKPQRTHDSLDSERLRIYNHLTALFPKEQVIQAMSALPEERNPEQICKYIILLKNSQQ